MQELAFNPWVATAFYGSFALFALLATWGKGCKSQVGAMLMICWLASLALWFFFPVTWRPAVFPILDGLFMIVAASCAKESGSRVPLILIGLSVVAIAASTAFSISFNGSWRQQVAYEISLNVIFVLQCVITGSWGIADVVGRAFSIRSGPHTGRGFAQYHRHSDDP